uniref:Uncharacterized protein n=1 Tax=Arion vulgaris TaxID=1028688 RepID=A0A0B7BHL9_9EUPU
MKSSSLNDNTMWEKQIHKRMIINCPEETKYIKFKICISSRCHRSSNLTCRKT